MDESKVQKFQGSKAWCKVFIESVDAETQKQIYSFLNHPSFAGSKIRIMPDCHAGAGAVIGTTATMTDSVIPNVVGVDIGCNIGSANIGKMKDIDFQALDDFIRKEIPLGFHHHNSTSDVTKNLAPSLQKDVISLYEEIEKNLRAKLDFSKPYLQSVGSLGGGNHFIELGKDEEDNIWVTAHSGSRGFGLAIAQYYQNKARDVMKEMYTGAAYHRMEFLTASTGMNEYLNDLKIAQRYALINRRIMVSRIINFLGVPKPADYVESIHNYIDLENKIIRKGAISANLNEKVIIPFNMEDGLIIGLGKGNSDWNNSAPHGAGRIGSRRWAKDNLDLEEAQQNMSDKGIWTSSLNEGTLDEVKGAYKSKDIILDAISDTVQILKFVKPIYNLKDSKPAALRKNAAPFQIPRNHLL